MLAGPGPSSPPFPQFIPKPFTPPPPPLVQKIDTGGYPEDGSYAERVAEECKHALENMNSGVNCQTAGSLMDNIEYHPILPFNIENGELVFKPEYISVNKLEGQKEKKVHKLSDNVTPNRVIEEYLDGKYELHYTNKGETIKGHTVVKDGKLVYARTRGGKILLDE